MENYFWLLLLMANAYLEIIAISCQTLRRVKSISVLH